MNLHEMNADSPCYPMVSVIIPCYNRTKPLKRAITSVLNQTFTDFEIIVVDDASTISINDVVTSLNDSRIKLIKHTENKNAAAARNTGGRVAKGKYIALLDSDDEWLPDHLERRIDKINKENSDGVYGAAIVNSFGKDFSLKEIEPVSNYPNMLEYLLSDGCRACTPSLFFKKDAFLDIMFDEELFQYQDFDFNIRFYQKYTYSFDKKPTVIVHRSSSDSMGNNINHSSCLKFIKKHKPKLPINTYIKVLAVMAKDAISSEGRSFNFYRYLFLLIRSKQDITNLKLVFNILFPGNSSVRN